MTPTGHSIEIFLARCRRRVLGLELAAGLLYLAAAWLVVLAVVGLLALWLSVSSAALLGWLGLAGGLVLVAWRFIWHPRARQARPERLIRLAEKSLAGTDRLEWTSALSFQRQAGEPPGPHTSGQLARAHVERVAAALAGHRPAELISSRRLARPLLSLLLAGAVMAVVMLAAPAAVPAGLRALGGGTAALAGTGSGGPPWVGDISVEYNYPDYSNRPPRLVEGSDGSITALPGTRVVLRAVADRDLAGGRLRFRDSEVPLAISGGRQLQAELLVTQADQYRFQLTSRNGEHWSESHPHPVVIEPDQPPRIDMLQPASDRQVTRRQTVKLLYQAGDDFGLGQVRLVWRLAGRPGTEQQRVLQRAARGQRRLVGRASFDLAPLDLEPGEQLQLYLEVTDNDTVRGPKTGRSAVCHLEVFSNEKQHDDLLQRLQQAWEGLLAQLADFLEMEPEAGPARAPDAERHRQLLRSSRLLAVELATLAGELAGDALAAEGLALTVRRVGRHLERLDSRLARLLERRLTQERAGSRRLAAARSERIRQLEKDVLYLEDLLDLSRLDEIGRLADKIARARRRLAQLLRRYAQAPDEKTRRQIAAEIARMKETIARLLDRQRRVLKGVRDEYINPEALARLLGDRDMLGALDELQRLLNQGRLDDALAQLERLDRQLGNLQAALEESRRRLGAGRYGKLAEQLGRMAAELDQLTRAQQQLLEQTGTLESRLLDRWKKKMQGRLGKIFDRLRRQLARIDGALQKLSRPRQSPLGEQGTIQRARQQVKLLDMALKNRDLAGGLESAEQLLEQLDDLHARQQLRRSFELGPGQQQRRPAGEREKLAAQAARQAREIYQQLARLRPDPRSLLGAGQRRRLGRLAGRQAELGGRLEQLRRQMQQLDRQAPLFGRPAQERLARGGRHMRQAAGNLKKLRPSRARPHQRQALAELQALRQALQKSCRSGGGGGMPLPLGSAGRPGGRDVGAAGGRASEREVELPSPEDFQPPLDYRRQLLEGMKDAVPEQYRQQVRRYYEELVK